MTKRAPISIDDDNDLVNPPKRPRFEFDPAAEQDASLLHYIPSELRSWHIYPHLTLSVCIRLGRTCKHLHSEVELTGPHMSTWLAQRCNSQVRDGQSTSGLSDSLDAMAKDGVLSWSALSYLAVDISSRSVIIWARFPTSYLHEIGVRYIGVERSAYVYIGGFFDVEPPALPFIHDKEFPTADKMLLIVLKSIAEARADRHRLGIGGWYTHEV
jgi:hypothetical protein